MIKKSRAMQPEWWCHDVQEWSSLNLTELNMATQSQACWKRAHLYTKSAVFGDGEKK